MRSPVRQLARLVLELVKVTSKVIALLADLLFYLVRDFAHWMFSRTVEAVRGGGSTTAVNALRPADSKAAPTTPARPATARAAAQAGQIVASAYTSASRIRPTESTSTSAPPARNTVPRLALASSSLISSRASRTSARTI